MYFPPLSPRPSPSPVFPPRRYYTLKMFHAERQPSGSNFKATTSIAIKCVRGRFNPGLNKCVCPPDLDYWCFPKQPGKSCWEGADCSTWVGPTTRRQLGGRRQLGYNKGKDFLDTAQSTNKCWNATIARL